MKLSVLGTIVVQLNKLEVEGMQHNEVHLPGKEVQPPRGRATQGTNREATSHVYHYMRRK